MLTTRYGYLVLAGVVFGVNLLPASGRRPGRCSCFFRLQSDLGRSRSRAHPSRSARDTLSDPAEQAAADRLIAAGLLEDEHGVLRPTPLAEATFRVAPEPRYLNWTA